MPQNSFEQQAMDRVRRMYGGFDTRTSPPVSQAPQRKVPEPERRDETPQKEENPGSADLLQMMLKDNERSLLLLLLLVLYNEGADSSLLVALMYMIL